MIFDRFPQAIAHFCNRAESIKKSHITQDSEHILS